MFSIEGQELPDAHLEPSGVYIFQPNIHSIIRLCATCVPSWHKHGWSPRKILQRCVIYEFIPVELIYLSSNKNHAAWQRIIASSCSYVSDSWEEKDWNLSHFYSFFTLQGLDFATHHQDFWILCCLSEWARKSVRHKVGRLYSACLLACFTQQVDQKSLSLGQNMLRGFDLKLWFCFSSNLWEGNFVTLSFRCPYSTKRNTTTRHLWMILESQPVDDSCTIWSNTWLTCTHIKVTCSDGLNPHSRGWMDTWKLLTMAHRHIDVNL